MIALLRRVAGHPRVVPLTALLLRARCVTPAVAFVARELARPGGLFAYRLRGGRTLVLIRHGSGDPVTLGEVFHERYYDPPPEIPEPARILDLGANVGLFGAYARERWPHAAIEALEPDRENAAVHRRLIALDGTPRWTLQEAAAGVRPGSIGFDAGHAALSRIDEAARGRVDAVDVLPRLAGLDLLKMDIEGGEWAILGDRRFAASPPRALVLEYHPYLCPGADPHGLVRELLERAGLPHRELWRTADGHGMLWAWRS